MANEIEERMATLRARKQALDSAWEARATVYEQHLDALVFLRDADTLEHWIIAR